MNYFYCEMLLTIMLLMPLLVISCLHTVFVCVSSGVIVSTPTGSTAYAVAAGASMIHPNVPAIMITPICPHSLSFRPIVVPAGVELKVCTPTESDCVYICLSCFQTWLRMFSWNLIGGGGCMWKLIISESDASDTFQNLSSPNKMSGRFSCLFISHVDHVVSWGQKHGLGVIWWKEETRDLPWRQVSPHTPLHINTEQLI